MGTAKFGVRNDDATLNTEKLKKVCENPNVKMIEIKLSQGAKPGAMSMLVIQVNCWISSILCAKHQVVLWALNLLSVIWPR